MRKILRQYSLAILSFTTSFTTAVNAQFANQMILNHNNVSCILTDEGGFFTNISSTNAAYEVPKGDSVNSIFAGSFLVGAQDPMGQIYFSGRKYSLGGSESSFHSGPIADPFFYGSISYTNAYQNALWKVSSEEIDLHQQNYQNAGYTVPNAILKWPGNGDATMGVAQQLAPYIDLNQNGIYEPVLGDYPDIRGDEAVYIIMNDESYLPDGNQMRIELHAMFYQFSTGNYLNNTTFMNVQVFNRSNINYMNYHQAIYIDYDIGHFADDRIGCSPDKNMLFAYNGDDFDETDGGENGYGPNPPCQALVSLSHPLKCGAAFTTGQDYFANGDTSLWLLMNSQWADSTPWVNPLSNLPTDFILPDNPNSANGWSEEAIGEPAGDRRGMITFYEPTFRPGTKICSDYAFIYSRVGARLQNVQDVWNIATSLQALYNATTQFPCQTSSVGILSEMKMPQKPFIISPNPASEMLTIESQFQTPYVLAIYNAMGQVVIQKQMQGLSNETIFLEALSKGCYLIKASDGQELFSEKLVVE
ncbi:MAG: hypothetical protein RLZZ211_2185 [Bacteroidota bacterium]|jgi:hypothetical protein